MTASSAAKLRPIDRIVGRLTLRRCDLHRCNVSREICDSCKCKTSSVAKRCGVPHNEFRTSLMHMPMSFVKRNARL